MYNHLLDTFKIVAEEGSFLKAAERCYISHTAVRKQINQLENHLGVKLFIRSQNGVLLNEAGKVLYARTLTLMKESSTIIEEVQAAYFASPHILKVGSSNLYPCHIFMDLWDDISTAIPNWQLKVVPIQDDEKRLLFLNDDYDFIVGPYDSLTSADYAFREIGKYRFVIAVPRNHPLSRKKEVSFKDMKGMPLMIMEKGTSPVNDEIREYVENNYPEINIVTIPADYDIQTFNRCVETGSLLLSLECWDRVHPEIKTIRLKEKYELPYGMTYRKDSAVMQEYLAAAEKTI